MNQLLRRIGLLDNLTLELPINKSDFVNTLRLNIDEEPQSDIVDIFLKSKNIYKGTVNNDGFVLKRKRKFFEMNPHSRKIKGTLIQKTDKLVVNIEISAFNFLMIPMVLFIVMIYVIFIVMLLTGNVDGMKGLWGLPFILFHAAFMLGFPYFALRRGLRSTKYDIERDLYFIMKDKLNTAHG
jgi:hypothetical protein